MRAIRERVGDDFHLQVKLSTTEYGNALMPWAKKGNTIEDSVEVARWVEQAGADAIHVSSGNTFPHPDNPAGAFSAKDVVATYDVMLSSGIHTFRNYLLFRTWPFSRLLERRARRSPDELEGANLGDAAAIKRAVSIPVLCTGGFQRASTIAEAIRRGDCDAVTIARALIATPDLVRHFEAGRDEPPNPCTYCNKCLYAVLESPLGCYDERRYATREEMLAEILSVYPRRAGGGGVVTTSATRYGKAEFLPREQREGTALCLSGGGYRAALFHLGALRRLNELGILAQVDTLTSVSGGSIFAAQLATHLAREPDAWPAGGGVVAGWEEGVARPMRAFVGRDIRTKTALRGFHPLRWFDQNAAIEALAKRYAAGPAPGRLDELPARPRFVICASDMRFREQWVFDSAGRIGSPLGRLVLAHRGVDARPRRRRLVLCAGAVPADARPRRRRGAARRRSTRAPTASGWFARSTSRTAASTTTSGSSRSGGTTRWCSSPTPRPRCPSIRRCGRSGARFATP